MNRSALAILILSSAATGTAFGQQLQPIEPTSVDFFAGDRTPNAAIASCHSGQAKNDALATLPNTIASSFYAKRDKGSGSLTFLTAGATVKKGDSVLQIWDYLQYREEIIGGSRARIGVGYRTTASYTVVSKNFTLGSIFKLGLSANRSEVAGEMTIQVLGITGKPIRALIPGAPQPVADSTILSIFEKMGALKEKVDDSDVLICPQVLQAENPPPALKL